MTQGIVTEKREWDQYLAMKWRDIPNDSHFLYHNCGGKEIEPVLVLLLYPPVSQFVQLH